MLHIRHTSHRLHSFHVDEAQPLPWDRPVATFMAQGRFYYIDVYSFPDADLLKKLAPTEDQVGRRQRGAWGHAGWVVCSWRRCLQEHWQSIEDA